MERPGGEQLARALMPQLGRIPREHREPFARDFSRCTSPLKNLRPSSLGAEAMRLMRKRLPWGARDGGRKLAGIRQKGAALPHLPAAQRAAEPGHPGQPDAVRYFP